MFVTSSNHHPTSDALGTSPVDYDFVRASNSPKPPLRNAHQLIAQSAIKPLMTDDRGKPNRLDRATIHTVRDFQAYMYYGEASVPGITNLVFSIINITVALFMIGKGVFCAGELARDGTLKLIAALATLAHAVVTLGNMLAPYITKIAQLIYNGGAALKHAMLVGGAVIAGIEAFVKGWQIIRQYRFDAKFEYKDILLTKTNFDDIEDLEAMEKAIANWAYKIENNKNAIIKLFGNDEAPRILGLLAKIKFPFRQRGEIVSTSSLRKEVKRVQKEFKIAFYNRNFTILHKEFFDISSRDDRAYVDSFGDTPEARENGRDAIANYKLIRAYRRMPCPALAAEVNNFTLNAADLRGDHSDKLIHKGNVKKAAHLFHRIETKSRHIKIAYAIGMIGLMAVAAAFIILTGGIGAAPIVFNIVFWSGWTVTLIGGTLESCWVRSNEDRIDLRYFLPNCLRKRWCDKSVHDLDLPGRVTTGVNSSYQRMERTRSKSFATAASAA
ncbi:MAG: hypothetical protein P0S95_08160 [Rhabdochlamydiaceae bacterium]|nr:hypothetical protein [Candidatus Amphrikana amoebophyrae]